ncbi:MAG TPA: NADH-quinone oxidoreductase subunit H [Planctomycetota bacterium]|nr:NADH-quinone oxidoreductase subunit H [Planctomycetota bacterium]
MTVHSLIHLVLVLLLPPLLLGVIARTKAVFAGRTGPPLLQPYHDLVKLLRKGMVISSATTAMFLAGPAVTLAATLAASLLVPLGHHAAVISFPGDMILFAYLLALGRFFTASAALDTGSPFEGMGAAREVTFAWLAEPSLFLGFVALARVSGSYSLTGMLADPMAPPLGSLGPMVLVVAGWFIVLLAENCRIPFDDPNTHLELTMIHEVMVLDHSGPALGAILYGAAVKLFVFAGLVLGVALPFTADAWTDWLLFVVSVISLAVVVGVVESSMARLRLLHIPKLLVSSSLLTAFAVVFLIDR